MENPLLSRETLKRIHSYMVQCRAAAKRGCKGLEAIEVATLVHLRPADVIVAGGNGWTSSRIEESPLAQMMAEIYPGEDGGRSPKVLAVEGSGDPIGMGTGAAFACQMRVPGSVVVVFGERTALSAAAVEAMALAGERKLPVLYVLENDLAARVSPAKLRKLDDEMNSIAAESGFPAMPVDGHDAVAVYRVAQESIARARKGGGPTLIECKTWRGKSGDARMKALWKPVDPIKHMDSYLKKKGL